MIVGINGEVRLSLLVSKCRKAISGSAYWDVHFEHKKNPDFTIITRLNVDNKTIKDYYILSRYDIHGLNYMKLTESNGIFLDMFKFEEIDWFFECFGRIRIKEVE